MSTQSPSPPSLSYFSTVTAADYLQAVWRLPPAGLHGRPGREPPCPRSRCLGCWWVRPPWARAPTVRLPAGWSPALLPACRRRRYSHQSRPDLLQFSAEIKRDCIYKKKKLHVGRTFMYIYIIYNVYNIYIYIYMVCQQEFTSSARSPSSARQLLRRRLRLAAPFLLGSSSLSESRMMEAAELETLPPILLSTTSRV